MLFNTKCIRKSRLRRSRRKRLLLVWVRRPAGQPDDIEGCADAAIRIAELFGVALDHALEQRALEWSPATLEHRICCRERAQIAHEREWRVIEQKQTIDIGDRKGQTQ